MVSHWWNLLKCETEAGNRPPNFILQSFIVIVASNGNPNMVGAKKNWSTRMGHRHSEVYQNRGLQIERSVPSLSIHAEHGLTVLELRYHGVYIYK